MGVRDLLGLMIHPETGEFWEVERGPQGGDEVNIVRAGRNYGWPVISYGQAYTGEKTQGPGASGPELAEPSRSVPSKHEANDVKAGNQPHGMAESVQN